MTSLYAWSKKYKINYDRAHREFNEGKIPGRREGNRIIVDDSYIPPVETKIKCRICDREMSQITTSHLKKTHDIMLSRYQEMFPGIPIVSSTVSQRISEKTSAYKRTDEHKKNLSSSIRDGFDNGRQAHNKGIIGVVKDSPETIEKKRQGRLGKKHTEETKEKIGAKSRGREKTEKQIELWRESFYKSMAEHGGGFNLGQKRNLEFSEKMSQIALNRPIEFTNARVSEMNLARKGQKISAEQRQKYSDARIKYMSENPQSFKDTLGELQLKEWFDSKNIKYIQQYVIDGIRHPYDFYLPDHNLIVEFDGAHHWIRPWFNIKDKSEEEIQEMLEYFMEKDAIENYEAGKLGYKISRIRGGCGVGDVEGSESIDDQFIKQGYHTILRNQ